MDKLLGKKVNLFIMIICVLLIGSCNAQNSSNVENNGNKVTSPNIKTSSTTDNSTAVESKTPKLQSENKENKAILDFVEKFLIASTNVKLESFKELLDNDGMYSITYFGDERAPNVVLHLNKDEIRDDLVLANSQKVGITLEALFGGDIVESKESILVNSSQDLDDISFGIDWHKNDETNVQNNLENILKTCEKVILINNEYVPQVFKLKNNIFIFTQSILTEEPYKEFIGEWLIFEKVNNEYKVRAVMKFQ